MIKRHTITGLKYFCKSTKQNYLKYLGSGVYWKSHLKIHGPEYVVTDWVSEVFYDEEQIKEFAILFSEFFNIVISDEWANLKIEDGLEGGMSSQTAKDMWGKPGVKELRIASQKEAQNRLDVKKKKSLATRELWNDIEHRTKVINSVIKTMNDPNKKKELSKIQKVVQNRPEVLSKRAATMADPVVKEKHRAATRVASNTPEAIERSKNKMLAMWENVEFKEKRSEAIKNGWDKGRDSRVGLNHVKADKTIYEFIHDSGLIEKCTRVEMKEKHKIGNISKLISGTIKSSMGWKVKR